MRYRHFVALILAAYAVTGSVHGDTGGALNQVTRTGSGVAVPELLKTLRKGIPDTRIEYEVTGHLNDHGGGKSGGFRFVFKSCNGMWKARHFVERGAKEVRAFEEAFDGLKYYASLASDPKVMLVTKNSFPDGPLPLSTPYINIPQQVFSFLTFSEVGVVPNSMKGPEMVSLFRANDWERFFSSAETVPEETARGESPLCLKIVNHDVGEANQTTTHVVFDSIHPVCIRRITKFLTSTGRKSYEVVVAELMDEVIAGIRFPKRLRFSAFKPESDRQVRYNGEATIRNFAVRAAACSPAEFRLDVNDYRQVWDLDNRIVIPVPVEK